MISSTVNSGFTGASLGSAVKRASGVMSGSTTFRWCGLMTLHRTYVAVVQNTQGIYLNTLVSTARVEILKVRV